MSEAKQPYIYAITYFDKSGDHAKLSKVFTQIAKNWVFQLEKCPTTGSLHFQCFINLHVRKRRAELIKLLCSMDVKGADVKPASENGKYQLKRYCMKDDTRVEGPWADKPLWKLSYLAKDLDCMKNPLPFQRYVLDIIKTEPDDRTIHWFYDPHGNNGKSKLCKYLGHHDMAAELPFGTATQIKSYIIAAGRHKAYILDVPRTTGSDESLADSFSSIEALKNGNVMCAMYGKVAHLRMEPPHVFVFSNHKPCKYLVSQDRWKVYEVFNRSCCDLRQEFYGDQTPVIQLKTWTCAKCAKKDNRTRAD